MNITVLGMIIGMSAGAMFTSVSSESLAVGVGVGLGLGAIFGRSAGALSTRMRK
jgi:hypothetical protein